MASGRLKIKDLQGFFNQVSNLIRTEENGIEFDAVIASILAMDQSDVEGMSFDIKCVVDDQKAIIELAALPLDQSSSCEVHIRCPDDLGRKLGDVFEEWAY